LIRFRVYAYGVSVFSLALLIAIGPCRFPSHDRNCTSFSPASLSTTSSFHVQYFRPSHKIFDCTRPRLCPYTRRLGPSTVKLSVKTEQSRAKLSLTPPPQTHSMSYSPPHIPLCTENAPPLPDPQCTFWPFLLPFFPHPLILIRQQTPQSTPPPLLAARPLFSPPALRARNQCGPPPPRINQLSPSDPRLSSPRVSESSFRRPLRPP